MVGMGVHLCQGKGHGPQPPHCWEILHLNEKARCTSAQGVFFPPSQDAGVRISEVSSMGGNVYSQSGGGGFSGPVGLCPARQLGALAGLVVGHNMFPRIFSNPFFFLLFL